MENGLLTTKEISEETRYKESTIRFWIAKGMIPHYRFGRQIRVKRSDMDQFLKSAFVPVRDSKGGR